MTGFSRIVSPGEIAASGATYSLEADGAARAAIAKRLGVPAVRRLGGEIEVRPIPRGLAVKGRMQAALERICVASLEPFEENLDETFDIEFSEDAAEAPESEEIIIDEDAPEPLPSDGVDLADILTQQAALAMAAYPRKPGVRSLAEGLGPPKSASPFAGLREAIAGDGEPE